MIDLLLRRAQLPGAAGLVDLGVDGGRLVAVDGADAAATHTSQATRATQAREVVDLAGRLVTTPLAEPHIHLDAVLTEGQPRSNASGSLFEGIAIWAQRVGDLTVEDVKDRVRRVLRWQLAAGVQHVRTHVDVCDPQLTALRALVELREEAAGAVDLQVVAFPQQGVFGYDGGTDLMRRAVELGADVVGGIPHYEMTREDGVESVRFAFALAEEFGLAVDIHCDETDDEQSRFVEVMAQQTLARGMAGRATASHVTAMHSYGRAYTHRLIANIARSGLAVVTNPLDNAVLQGRFDTGPVRRGVPPVKALLEAGVVVAIGQDSVVDPWYPLGRADPLQAAFVLAHTGHLSGADELRQLLAMITTDAARVLGLPAATIEPGQPADLVVFDAPSEAEALRLQGPRFLVLRGGAVVARTRPAQTTVTWLGEESELDLSR